MSMFIFFGQLVFTCGIYMESYVMLVVGRVIFGLGGENLITCQCVCAEKWFKGRMLATAMGLNMFACYFGTCLNNFLTPYMIDSIGDPKTTCLIIMGILCMSMFATFYYIFVNYKYKYMLEDHHQDRTLVTSLIDDGVEKIQNQAALEIPAEETFQLRDIFNLKFKFWCVCGSAITMTCTYFEFMSFATDYFQYRYDLSYSCAKNFAAGIPLIVMVVLLIFSNLTQKYGKKGLMLLISSSLSVITFGLVYFIPINGKDSIGYSLIPAILIGIYFGIYQAAYWPSIAMIVDRKS